MRVSFDLDEVLFVSPETHKTEPELRFPYNRIYKERLRLGAPELINRLQELGYDVTPTGSYDQATREAVAAFGEKIAVGVDLKDGFVAVKGWTETTALTAEAFFAKMRDLGVKTLICTDVSRDGAMRGANLELDRTLSEAFDLQITASGGVSSMEDVLRLREMGLYGAIVGKAYYTGALDLRKAVEAAR